MGLIHRWGPRWWDPKAFAGTAAKDFASMCDSIPIRDWWAELRHMLYPEVFGYWAHTGRRRALWKACVSFPSSHLLPLIDVSTRYIVPVPCQW
eukprot:4987532-Pyramimonas_sp.AAC.1